MLYRFPAFVSSCDAMQNEVVDTATWRATDGTEVTIRPIARADLALEQEFVNGLSRQTGYQRLLSGRRLSPEEVRRFTDIDPNRECALIATTRDSGGEREIGVVTSGAKTPTVGEFVGLAYVRSDLATPGTELSVEVRGRRLAARVVPRPFYRRAPRRRDT